MNKFLFKSNDSDLQKITSIYRILDTIQKNVLYETHQVDKILKLLQTLTTDKDLQEQVDKFFVDDDKESD